MMDSCSQCGTVCFFSSGVSRIQDDSALFRHKNMSCSTALHFSEDTNSVQMNSQYKSVLKKDISLI